ncbi:MFS transporter [Rhodococcus sp. X156]|uniref:MFS transporter n=1 Tax=Rhodococcus sp. X156 TaxID=2499145 RepID=UPI0019D1B27A|nr:MFS transporter [Rhodococcus sp. X156]
MPELSRGRRLLVLAICCMSLLIVGMDNTIVNVALPSIGADLGASLSGLQWTVDAYILVLASLLMLSGSMADRFGRRRVFQLGLVLFTAGSALCSIAPSLGWLVAFRMVQAIGGSMLNPVAMSIITNVFTDPRERAQAIGVWGGVVGISLGVGPVLGGVLIETAGWPSIFWVNIPLGILALGLAWRYVPESKAPRPRRADLVGQALVIVLLASLTYAIIEAPRVGWGSWRTLVLLGVAVAALVALLRYEPRRADPLVELRFFRSAPFSGATVIAVSAFGAFAGLLFLGTLYLQEARGLSALRAGLCILPLAVMTFFLAPLSGRIVGSRGPRVPLLLAGAAMCAGGLMLVDVGAETPMVWVIASLVVFGAGFGLVNAPITNTAMAGMPRAQAGVAAAVASTSRQVGTALGVAVVGSLLSAGLAGAAVGTGFPDASRAAWWVVVAGGAAVFVVGGLSTNKWSLRTAARTAALLQDEERTAAAPA